MFTGHQLYKINNNWMFDLTTSLGYYVTVEKGIVKSCSKAFMVYFDTKTGSYSFYKYRHIPVNVLRKAVNIIDNYNKTVAVYQNSYN